MGAWAQGAWVHGGLLHGVRGVHECRLPARPHRYKVALLLKHKGARLPKKKRSDRIMALKGAMLSWSHTALCRELGRNW